MSEAYFLQKCIVTAEDAKGSYTDMSLMEDVDSAAKTAYEGMVSDIGKHLIFLNARLNYLNQRNEN